MTDFSSDRNPVEQLAEEFMARQRRGEKPSLSEYTTRYPELADDIRDLFPALVVMEELKPGAVDVTGAYQGADGLAEGKRLERLGDFRILREVGRGGMGIVYEAEQESLGRHVALKVLPAHALLDPRHLHRFRREAKSAARLHHTNIVPVYGVGDAEGVHYYVMQFIQGLGLDQVLVELKRLRQVKGSPEMSTAAGPRASGAVHVSAAEVAQSLLTGNFQMAAAAAAEPPEDSDEHEEPRGTPTVVPAALTTGEAVEKPEAVVSNTSSSVHLPGQPQHSALSDATGHYWQSVARMGLQVADALAYAHAQGTLHRDIKPSNLLLDTQGTVWITDFGLAKAVADQDNLTNPGDIVGTLRYMAPERFQGKSDARGDIYGLGLTLYELLAFRSAFDESERNRLIHQLTHEEPPALRKLNPQVPRDLETIVHKALARDPGHRYATAAELADDLRRFVEDKPIRARRVSRVEHVWRWCRRNPALALLTAVALVLLATVAVVASIGYAETSAALRREAAVWQEWVNAREAARLAQEKKAAAEQGAALAVEKSREAELGAANALEKSRQAEVKEQNALKMLTAHSTQLATASLERGLELCAKEGKVAQGLLWFHRALGIVPAGDQPLQEACRANLAAWRQRLSDVTLPHANNVGQVLFSGDRKTVLTMSGQETRLWDVASGEPIGEPLENGVFLAVFSPDHKSVLTANNIQARLWGATTGKPIGEPLVQEGNVNITALSPDGRTIFRVVMNGDRYEGRLSDAVPRATAAPMVLPGQVVSALFSPDGKTILMHMATNQEIALWNVATRQPIGQPVRFSSGGSYTTSFSPDSKTVLLWGPLRSQASERGQRQAHRRAPGHSGHAQFPDLYAQRPDPAGGPVEFAEESARSPALQRGHRQARL